MRVFLVIALLVLFSGCISDQSDTTAGDESPTDKETPTEQWTQKDEEAILKQISIFSEAFENGSNIPVDYTCDGDDRSPALLWEGLPDGSRSIALIVDDPDAPRLFNSFWINGSWQKRLTAEDAEDRRGLLFFSAVFRIIPENNKKSRRPRQNLGPLGDIQYTCRQHGTARCDAQRQ